MNGLHILFISSWYPDLHNPTRGIFNRAFAEAASLHARVSVLHVSADANAKRTGILSAETEGGIFTVRVTYKGAQNNIPLLSKFVQYQRRIKASRLGFSRVVADAGLPDVIQLNVVIPAGPAALMLARSHKIPLVINECWTGFDPLDGRYSGVFFKLITRKVLMAAKIVMPVTAYLKNLMISHGLPANYKIIPNVIDTEIFCHKSALTRKMFRMLHVSALDDRQKNVSGIMEAFVLFREKISDDAEADLIIAGDGDDADFLQEKAATLCHDKSIRFIGACSPSEISNEMNNCDALVMFSNYETFCVTIPEALACGKPVITSDAGGVLSYMNSSLGIVVPKMNISALAAAMTEMSLKHRQYDPDILRAFVVERFSKKVVGEKLLDIYKTAIADK